FDAGLPLRPPGQRRCDQRAPARARRLQARRSQARGLALSAPARPRASGDPALYDFDSNAWIPACAGMSGCGSAFAFFCDIAVGRTNTRGKETPMTAKIALVTGAGTGVGKAV